MIGLNQELLQRHQENRPVRIGMIGAGQMGVDVVAQVTMMRGIDVVAIADIDINRAESAYEIAGMEGSPVKASSAPEADEHAASGERVFTRDCRVITNMSEIDVMLEATRVPDVGAKAALLSACAGQQLAMMNAETDITVGPLLNWYTQKKGVLYALAAGDEPLACKELHDFADSPDFTVVAAGQGKNNPLDRHAKPTDEAWAREAARPRLNPNMQVESVDGSKTMIEKAAVSNATGLVADVRGMHGPKTSREKLNETFALREHGGVLNKTGVMDYGIGGISPGVFLVVTTKHPRLRKALECRDMGDGPYYTLFRPFHVCGIEVPLTCAMLAIRKKSNMMPLNRLVSEVFAVAKQNLAPGHQLGGIGGCDFRGLIDDYETARRERLVPVGLAEGAEVIRPVLRDCPITYDDVRLNEDSTVFKLRRLQDGWMDGQIDEVELLESVDQIAQEQ